MGKHTEQDLMVLAQKIKPVMRFNCGGRVQMCFEDSYDKPPLMYITVEDIRTSVWELEPLPIKKGARLKFVYDVRADEIPELGKLSNPTIEDILQFMPRGLLGPQSKVCAFEIYEDYHQRNRRRIHLLSLYEGKLPKKVKEQDISIAGMVRSNTQNQRG